MPRPAALVVLLAFTVAAPAADVLAGSKAGDPATPATPATSDAGVGEGRPAPAWRLDAGAMLDRYELDDPAAESRDGEHALYVQLGRRLAPGIALAAGVERSRQFDTTDHRLNVHGYWSPLPKWSLDALAAIAPGASILPRRQVAVGGEYQARPWLALLGALQTSSYADEQITTYGPGVRLEFLPQATLEVRYLHGGSSIPENPGTDAGQAKVAWTMGSSWHPYLLFSQGDENQPPLGIGRVTTYAAGAVIDLDDAWSLRIDGLIDVRDSAYVRTSLGGGVICRF